MTGILAYNIQTGGTNRTDKLATIIAATGADVIGLTEATNPQAAQELADRLGMHLKLSGQARSEKDWHLGVLSRLPVIDIQAHVRPDIFTKQHLLEVGVEEADGKQLTVFVVHLTAHFYKGPESDRVRRLEVQEILRVMASRQGTPHLLMGDFNAIAPGEDFKVSALLQQALDPDQEYFKKYKDFIQRSELDFITRSYTRILETIPQNTFTLADKANPFLTPRAGIELLQQAGYVDCYRRIKQDTPGFTYPSWAPAGRIDFIFASPELAQRLSAAYVVVKAAGLRSEEASDHLPVFAEFA